MKSARTPSQRIATLSTSMSLSRSRWRNVWHPGRGTATLLVNRIAPLNMKQVNYWIYNCKCQCTLLKFDNLLAVCETIYHEDEVDDDVANCVTEMICKDPDTEVCEEEEKIPRRKCTVDQETNKKVWWVIIVNYAGWIIVTKLFSSRKRQSAARSLGRFVDRSLVL